MPAPPTVQYASPEFDDLLTLITTPATGGAGVVLLFEHASDEDRQIALGRLADHTKLSLHQVNLDTLYTDRLMVTQGNLRESFDTAGEAPSILAFAHADRFFQQDEQQAEAEGRDEDALTPVDYLFERSKAFKGIIVLSLHDPDFVAEAREIADYVVTF